MAGPNQHDMTEPWTKPQPTKVQVAMAADPAAACCSTLVAAHELVQDLVAAQLPVEDRWDQLPRSLGMLL